MHFQEICNHFQDFLTTLTGISDIQVGSRARLGAPGGVPGAKPPEALWVFLILEAFGGQFSAL